MVVYAEYVFIDNLIIDYLLLSLTRKTLKLNNKFPRLLIPSSLGATASAAMPLLRLNDGWLFVFKLILSVTMTALSGKFRNLKEFTFCYYLFLFLTFLFGGGVLAVTYLIGVRYDALYGINDGGIPLGLITAICAALYAITFKLTDKLCRRKEISSFLVECKIFIEGRSFSMKGFIDSGNRLVHKKTGSPVILCSPSAAKEIFFALNHAPEPLDKISVNTVTGKTEIKIYKTDGIMIYRGDKPNIINNVVMGLSSFEFDGDGDFDLILSPALV